VGPRGRIGRLFFSGAAAMLILAGCGPKIERPTRICPGRGNVLDSLSVLRARREKAIGLRANGQCLLSYYDQNGKPKKENFLVRLWMNPPAEFYLQGDVGFDAKGIVLGSNEREFWLSIRPKEISTYWWGRWAETGSVEKLMISPRAIIEAVGIAQVDGGDGGNWSLSNEGPFDVLTKRNERGAIIKKVYAYSCDYTVRKIEYFDMSGRAGAVAELSRYKEVCEGFSIPTVIKIVRHGSAEKQDSVRVTLESVKPESFTEQRRLAIFTRPEPRGFEHVSRLIGGELVEQPR